MFFNTTQRDHLFCCTHTRSQSPDLTSAEWEERNARTWEELMDEKRRMHDCLWVYDDDGSEISYIGETEAV